MIFVMHGKSFCPKKIYKWSLLGQILSAHCRHNLRIVNRCQMNFYKRYMGDYQRDTADLTLIQHGVFTMLLDTYFSTEKPLAADQETLCRICRAASIVERRSVMSVADRFFPISDSDGMRHNHRADKEIEAAQPKIKAARENGAKGGRRKSLNKTQ